MSEENKVNEPVAENTPAENKAETVETAVKTKGKKAAKAKAPKAAKKAKNNLADIEKALMADQANPDRFEKFGVGDTVKVYVKIIEGDKQRIQPFEGTVLAIRHGGLQKSFIVRRISHSVAIERVFPFYSPFVEKVEIVRKGKVRRAKLYYLRGRFGRSAVITEKV